MKRLAFRVISIVLISVSLSLCISYFTEIETLLGLDVLFLVRGATPPPSNIVIIAMDETSEARLNVGLNLTYWRPFHAQLIEKLHQQGVAFIIFDLQFITEQPTHDLAFSNAIKSAGNVLVTDCVQELIRGNKKFYGREECSENNRKPFVQEEGHQESILADDLITLRKVTATPIIANVLLDHAPFYLANDIIIRDSWIFIDSLAEMPSLPVLAWLYSLERAGALKNTVYHPTHPISDWLTAQRRACLSSKYKTLDNMAHKSTVEQQINEVVCQSETRQLNFYGPPGTFRVESYSDVYDGKITDLKDKIIFIGKANHTYSPSKIDFFQTPFVDTETGRMAGVEIMATQFANLQDNNFIASPFPNLFLLILSGLIISLLFSVFTGVKGIIFSVLFSIAYTVLSIYVFKYYSLWLPIAVFLCVQLPASWLISLLCSHCELLKERKRLQDFARRVFPQWAPFLANKPGQWYLGNTRINSIKERNVNGLCLATDIEGYTTVAANHTSHEMWQLLNTYYKTLEQPVSRHGGIIADVTGDAMMSLWIDIPIYTRRLAACLAALEIAVEVARFNEASTQGRLPTRIGLHEGDMTLGSLDAGAGSHFRAIGDTINTSSRIQGVNKFLGTQILASAAIARPLTDVVYRSVGFFRLVGRIDPIELMEIVGNSNDVNASKLKLHQQFSKGLHAFQQGQWQDAVGIFKNIQHEQGIDDGPTRFYLTLALCYQKTPPICWDGIVTLNEK